MSGLDTTQIRKDFPLLAGDSQTTPVYFDNACMTLKPISVLSAMEEYYRDFPACGGRSHHHLGDRVTNAIVAARQVTAQFINAQIADEVVFLRNTTEGINMLAYTLSLQPGDIILTSDKEHNSNLVPWQLAAKRSGATHKVIPTSPNGQLDMAKYEQTLADENVKVVAMGWESNLDGVAIPVADVIAIAHAHGALVVLDAAQTAPHQRIDVQALDTDFLVFSGHKLGGPTGTGVLYGKYNLLEGLSPFLTGGSTVGEVTYTEQSFLEAPAKFEAGLQDYAGIIGLATAINYIQEVGLEQIAAHQIVLNEYATAGLQQIEGCHILGPLEATKRGGILNFYIDGIDVHHTALLLDKSVGVALRSGQHCVHSWFASRELNGSVRASFYMYNTKSEIDRFLSGVADVVAVNK